MKFIFLIIIPFILIINESSAQDLSEEEIIQLNKEIKSQLFPGTSNKNITFDFKEPFKEITILINDSIKLNGLYFPSKNPKGLIFYLHGSNSDLSEWGKISSIYTTLNYDLFMIDYRGYGKSNGKFINENQWYADMQMVYEYLKNNYYPESKIIILGQSIGTAAASYLAANNHPDRLILQAPFYSFADWTFNIDPNLNPEILELKLENNKNVEKVTAPIIIFHGDQDSAVYYGSSLKLMEKFKKKDRLITLKGEGHNDFTKNQQYLKELREILVRD